jgi:hypothetical protein
MDEATARGTKCAAGFKVTGGKNQLQAPSPAAIILGLFLRILPSSCASEIHLDGNCANGPITSRTFG